MRFSSNNKAGHYHWVGGFGPSGDKRTALLIPQFNESGNENFERRLEYFQRIKEKYDGVMDTIVIDDGSTDGSLEKLRQFAAMHSSPFYLASVFPNAEKVGALYAAILSISHEFIILSDFDTDLFGIERLLDNLDALRGNPVVMGGYFRMLPYEGAGLTFRFQQLEYSLLRCLYKYHHREQTIPIMPGAGCCYKRSILLTIYEKHSGLRNGEDREATLLGLKMGYKTVYMNEVMTLTRPPLSFRSLVRQRKRWYLGYIETLNKERRYYRSQISNRTSIGVRTVLEAVTVLFILMILPMALTAFAVSPLLAAGILLLVYLSYVVGSLYLLLSSREESGGLDRGMIGTLLLFPFLKVCLEHMAWGRAIAAFWKKRNSYRRVMPGKADIYIYQQAARFSRDKMERRDVLSEV